MATLSAHPYQLREGDYLPEFGGTVSHVRDRRTTSESGAVEVFFKEEHMAPLGFLPSYTYLITVER